MLWWIKLCVWIIVFLLPYRTYGEIKLCNNDEQCPLATANCQCKSVTRPLVVRSCAVSNYCWQLSGGMRSRPPMATVADFSRRSKTCWVRRRMMTPESIQLKTSPRSSVARLSQSARVLRPYHHTTSVKGWHRRSNVGHLSPSPKWSRQHRPFAMFLGSFAVLCGV